jgi:integrase
VDRCQPQKNENALSHSLAAGTLGCHRALQTYPPCVNKDGVLPVWSNQKLNEYLKEIAALCGMQKRLTYHMARHTFATTVTLNNGVSIETVSKMLGHKSIMITQHYAKIMDGKISEDMKALKNKLTHGMQAA